VPALAGIGGLVVIAAAAFFYFKSGGSDDGQEETLAQESAAAGAAGAANAAAEPTPAETTPAADAGDEAPPADEPPAEEAPPPEPPPKAEADPSSVDLGALPDFGPAQGCTPERFAELTGLMNVWMDPASGAKGNRARIQLLEDGRLAFPVILNKMKTLDFSTDEGKSLGDQCQKTLEKICNGINFDWRYTTEPKDVLFNKKVVVAWSNQWQKVVDQGIEYWIKMIKLDDKNPGEAANLRKQFGGEGGASAQEGTPTPPPASDDDLDVD